MAIEQLIDPWTWYDFKPSFGGTRTPAGITLPTWIGDHHRRLQAYKFLESYSRNSARLWMSSEMDEQDVKDRREYGDANTILDQIVTSILGDDQSIVVGTSEEERKKQAAKKQLKLLTRWADKENFFLKMLQAEKDAVTLGDAVYVLGWDPDSGRPKIEVWDPGFYFPVVDPENPSDEYPEKVHIAYEYEIWDDIEGKDVRYLRRITWELLESPVEEEDDEFVQEFDFPWNEETTSLKCFMTDATWRIDDVEGEVDAFDLDRAMFAEDEEGNDIDRLDLDIDFIPVIHMPNTPAGAEHFGTSSLAPVIQILDDLMSTDTDLQAASATTGTPPIAVSGGSVARNEDGQIDSYGPGTVIETGDGTATMIDTSRSLDALLKYDEHLMERASVNARVPESLLGRVKPNEVPSGIALTLSFAPHTSMIHKMRRVRDIKNKILLKFVMRFFQQFSDEVGDDEEILDCTVKFGSFLPADRKEASDLVQQLRNMDPPAISLATAVRMLVEAGFPIEDAAAEVEAIEARDFSGAGEMLDATADPDATRKYLRLPGAPPAPPTPPPGPGPTGVPQPEPTQELPPPTG